MDEGLVVLVRAFIGFFSLLIFARVMGKEQISQLNLFDYILGITIGSMAATLTTDLSSRAWPHWVGLITWCLLGYLMDLITTKWRYASKVLEGEPAIVIMNGKIMENVLRKMKYRISEILELLRNQGIFDPTQVDFAIIEPNGQLSVLLKPENQPLGNDDNIPQSIETVVQDINHENWEAANQNTENLNRVWDKVVTRVQFSAERNELDDLTMNIARLKGAIQAKDKAGGLTELSEAYEHWKNLGD